MSTRTPLAGATSPPPSEAQLVAVTGSAQVEFGQGIGWAEFCAKVAALAERVPADKAPAVFTRHSTNGAVTVVVSWAE